MHSRALRWGKLAFNLSGIAFITSLYRVYLADLPKRLSDAKITGVIVKLSVIIAFTVFISLTLPSLFIYLSLYWLVPLATWAFTINHIRVITEHFPSHLYHEREVMFRSREIPNNLIDLLFVGTRNANYHLSHHLFPKVPFYNLHKLHRVISEAEAYRRRALISKSYLHFYCDYLMTPPNQVR